jgi:hypothetical protein
MMDNVPNYEEAEKKAHEVLSRGNYSFPVNLISLCKHEGIELRKLPTEDKKTIFQAR